MWAEKEDIDAGESDGRSRVSCSLTTCSLRLGDSCDSPIGHEEQADHEWKKGRGGDPGDSQTNMKQIESLANPL